MTENFFKNLKTLITSNSDHFDTLVVL